jgi:DNA topoisomerase VI subunit B
MKTIECDLDVANFTKSLKSIGYNHYSAILDLIDNSISAGANKIWVDYYKEKKGSYRIVIADNGCGMKREDLIEALRIASSDPTVDRQQKDLGKFGYEISLIFTNR